MKYSLPRITEELTKYVIDRQDFSSPHQDHPRNEWIRSILRGMAEVSGENGDQAAANFDQCLERVWGMPSRTWLSSFEEKHIIRILYRYAAGLEQLEGDQRGCVLEVLKLLNDIFIHRFFHVFDNGILPAKRQVEEQLLHMQLHRPIRFTFTRVFVGVDPRPCGSDFLPGPATDVNSVRNTSIFQELANAYPQWKEWPAVCTVYQGGGGISTASAVDADELDMAIIREIREPFLKRPEVELVCSRELLVPVRQRAASKSQKRKEPER